MNIYKLRPLRGYVILRLDPQPKRTGTMWHPDEDYIRMCKTCNLMMEELAQPCLPKFEFGWDKNERVPELRAVHYKHDIETIAQPVMPNPTQPATIIRSSAPPFVAGDRVLVQWGCGESLDPDASAEMDLWRKVSGDAILGYVEDEA